MIKVLLTLLAVISCANLGLVKIEKEELKAYPEFNRITFASSETANFEIVEVIDARINKDNIGEALVGVYFEKTPVSLYKDTNAFLKDYFYSSLSARNFTLVEGSENQVTIIINKLWVDELIEKFKPERAKCVVDLSFKMKNSKGESTIKLWNTVISKGDLGDATKKLAPTLASCLNEAVEKLVKNNSLYQFL